MKKKIAMMVVLTLMACSLCGVIIVGVDFPNPVEGLKKVAEVGTTPVFDGTTPDDGVPGGPPGIPG